MHSRRPALTLCHTGLHPAALRSAVLLAGVLLALLLVVPLSAQARTASGGKRVERPGVTEVFDAQRQIGPIYYPAHADKQDPEYRAAQELARYLGKISGGKWQVLPEPASLSARGVFVGHTRRAFADGLWRAQNPHAPLKLLTDRIDLAVLPTHVSLVGENPQATLTGVYRFLETHTGARWYAPGELGEEIPSLHRLALRRGRSHWQPSFRDRGYHSRDRDFRLWAQRAGDSSHFSFNHNLHRIFTPDLYARHPEYWALVGGERKGPGNNERRGQLDYTHPAVADLTAQAAREAFDAVPRVPTFSLGINDTIDFGDDEATMAAISPLRYHHGHPVFSDLIFSFANSVAQQVGQSHPDRFLPVLAYMWAEQVPSFPLEPNLMPYLCLDRAQWYDPERRRTDMELTRQWADSGVREMGSWEYYLSGGFFIPRIYNQITAESLKFAHEAGVRSIFFESGSVAGFDAAKMWLATRLVWDIDANPQALLHDFYSGYYGAAAATMQELYEYCETLWMQQQGRSYWLKYFYNINQASLFPPSALEKINTLLARARAELDAAHAPERFHARLERDARSFAYLEAASRYYHVYCELMTMPLADAAQVGVFLERLEAFAPARRALEAAPQLHRNPAVEMRAQLLELQPAGRLAAVLYRQPELATAVTADRSAAADASLLPLQVVAGAAKGHLIFSEDFSSPLVGGDAAGFAPQRSVTTQLDSGWNLRLTHHENARLVRSRGEGRAGAGAAVPAHAGISIQAEADSVAGAAAPSLGDSLTGGAVGQPPQSTGAKSAAQSTGAESAAQNTGAESAVLNTDAKSAAQSKSVEAPVTAEWALTLENQEFLSLFRWLEVPAGASAVGTGFEVAGVLDPGSQFRVSLSWLDKDHKAVGQSVHNLLPPGDYTQGQAVGVAAVRPEGAVWVYIGIRLQNQAPDEPLSLRQWQTFAW